MENNNWISVEDRLPNNDAEVLAYENLDGKNIFAWYSSTVGWKAWGYGSYFEPDWVDCNVTHWQPLPKPPRNKK